MGMLGEIRDACTATMADLEDRKAERTNAKLPKTIEENWPGKVDRLCKMCKMCNVEDPSELPNFWNEAVALVKGNGTIRSLLQDAVEEVAQEYKVKAPHVSVSHSTTIQNWLFSSTSVYDITTGLLHFTVTPPGAISAEAMARDQHDHERSAYYETIMDGSTKISANDARRLRTEKDFIPLRMSEKKRTLKAYSCLIGAILGSQHPNVVEHFESIEA